MILRYTFFFLILTLQSARIIAQDQPLVLFGPGGGMSFGNTVYLSYSFGEPCSAYHNAENQWLTEGVQQPEKINLMTGVRDIDPPSSFSFYPNPAHEVLHLEWSDDWICKRIRIENGMAQKIYDQLASDSHHQQIEITHWVPGIYYLRLANDQNQEFIQAFIKI